MTAEKTSYPRVQQALSTISEHERALEWIEKYGAEIANDRAFKVMVRSETASACQGANEAFRVLSAYAMLNMPEVVKTAAQSCRNTIALERDAITAEMAKS